MHLHNLLHLDPKEPVFLAENSFSDQRQALLTENYLLEFENFGDIDAIESVQLVEHGVPIAIAVYVHSQGLDHWLVLTNVISKDERFSKRASYIFGGGGGNSSSSSGSEEIEIRASDLRCAVIEYYSTFLANQWLCESCAREDMPYLDLGVFVEVRELLNRGVGAEDKTNSEPDARSVRLLRLFREMGRGRGLDLSGADALEICCGDGSATTALRDLGCDPICIDYDKCDICDGIKSGQLRKGRSIVLDATELSSFFGREFDCVIGFMLGPVHPFNEGTWASILRESVKVVRTGGLLIFTFHDREELLFAEKILGDCGVSKETITIEGRPGNESPAGRGTTGYDRWVYVGRWGLVGGAGSSSPSLLTDSRNV